MAGSTPVSGNRFDAAQSAVDREAVRQGIIMSPTGNRVLLRKYLADCAGGVSRRSCAFMCDSTGSGVGTFPSAGNAVKKNSYPNKFAAFLAAAGVPVAQGSTFGQQGLATGNFPTFDPQVTIGAGWGFTSVGITGSPYVNSTTTNALTFLPAENVDTFVVNYTAQNNGATLAITIDGGAPATGGSTLNTNNGGAATITEVTFTAASPGSHTLSLARNGTGSQAVINSIRSYDSTKTQLEVWNWGWGGATTTNWNDTATVQRALNLAKFFAPSICVIDLGINDRKDSAGSPAVAIATSEANKRALITGMQSVGSLVILKVPIPSAVATQTLATQRAYSDLDRSLATELDLFLFDTEARIPDQATYFAAGMYFDNNHGNGSLYADEGKWMANAFMAL